MTGTAMPLPEDDDLVISCGGYLLTGWDEIRVTRGVERLPSDFVIGTERFPGIVPTVPVVAGTSCTVSVKNRVTGATDPLLTGYIDAYEPEYDKDGHHVMIGGRSKTEDLVDSSADFNRFGAALIAPTVGLAAEKLASQFGIGVMLPNGDFKVPPPNSFPINPGATAYTLLEAIMRRLAQCPGLRPSPVVLAEGDQRLGFAGALANAAKPFAAVGAPAQLAAGVVELWRGLHPGF